MEIILLFQAIDYDVNGDFVRTWVPELKGVGKDKVHFPWQVG